MFSKTSLNDDQFLRKIYFKNLILIFNIHILCQYEIKIKHVCLFWYRISIPIFLKKNLEFFRRYCMSFYRNEIFRNAHKGNLFLFFIFCYVLRVATFVIFSLKYYTAHSTKSKFYQFCLSFSPGGVFLAFYISCSQKSRLTGQILV